MEISIKLNPQDYQRLRRQMPAKSPAREAMDKASRIEHALEGIQFEGYAFTCNEKQAEIIFGIAKQCCPDVVPEIENGIMLARSQSSGSKLSR
jgi:hypothetical protein